MIKMYNTLSNKIEEFIPLKDGEVSMYVCGPTVYNYIHIGNARPAIFFDTVRRYLEYRGYKVKYVQNFTDVDDKMIIKANEEGVSIEDIAKRYIDAYFEDTSKVNLKEEGMIRPKATDHIGEMIGQIKKLIDGGYAYEVEGDVYFNVKAYKDEYGQLSNQRIDDLQSGARIGVNDIKKSPVDFALWKKSKEGEPSWNSPWGKGRPGWHIECSAMSSKYLGDTFDIHGGGQDLIFPHHENEIAQSKCSTNGEFAKYWLHNGYINIKGEKMSKSKGNFFLLREVLEEFDGPVVRYFVLSSHYRKPIDFSHEELNQSKSSLNRILNTLDRIDELKEVEGGSSEFTGLSKVFEEGKEKFVEGMDNDFNTAYGIGAIFEIVKEVNKELDRVEDKVSKVGLELFKNIEKYIREVFEEVLGVSTKREKSMDGLTPELVELLLEVRTLARKNKNFELSDMIRDRLLELGVAIKDGRDKTSWSIL